LGRLGLVAALLFCEYHPKKYYLTAVHLTRKKPWDERLTWEVMESVTVLGA
jgi:hypothetical protein